MAAVLVHPGLAAELHPDLPNWFFDTNLARALSHIQAYVDQDKSVDINLLHAQMRDAGEDTEELLRSLASACQNEPPTPSMAKDYVATIAELAARREGMQLGFELQLNGRDRSAKELLDLVQGRLDRISRIGAADVLAPQPVGELLTCHPAMRPAVIGGLLREGETMNFIAASKIGKSWAILDLVFALMLGEVWLENFACRAGRVLLVDNELHPETLAGRIRRVAEARGLDIADLGDRLQVLSLRGKGVDLFRLETYFRRLKPGSFSLIVLDAFYRFLPPGSDENSNADVAKLYNLLDRWADRLGCAFVLVHHSTKGNQSGKGVTDVGAGAGSQSRAADTHLVLRPHEQPEVVVLDAVCRSWPPVAPCCLRWKFPRWIPDFSLDPAALRRDRPRRPRANSADESRPTESDWDRIRFVERCLTAEPTTLADVISRAVTEKLSTRRAKDLLKEAETGGLAHRWKFRANEPHKFATVPQPLLKELNCETG